MKYFAIVLIVTACSRASAGQISDYYFKAAKTNHEERSKSYIQQLAQHAQEAPEISTNFGITEIGIERSGCFGTCPAYTFIVRSDGTFLYHGDSYVARKGDYTGTIPD